MKYLADACSLSDQLPHYKVIIKYDKILIDGDDYRLDYYGGTDNRVVFSDKLRGVNTIKKFGSKKGKTCLAFYVKCLEKLGVDTTALEFAKEK